MDCAADGDRREGCAREKDWTCGRRHGCGVRRDGREGLEIGRRGKIRTREGQQARREDDKDREGEGKERILKANGRGGARGAPCGGGACPRMDAAWTADDADDDETTVAAPSARLVQRPPAPNTAKHTVSASELSSALISCWRLLSTTRTPLAACHLRSRPSLPRNHHPHPRQAAPCPCRSTSGSRVHRPLSVCVLSVCSRPPRRPASSR